MASIEDFRTRMTDILDRNFATTLGDKADRSPGLDPQSGLVVGLTCDLEIDWLLEVLPPVWSVYDSGDRHITLADDLGGSSKESILTVHQLDKYRRLTEKIIPAARQRCLGLHVLGMAHLMFSHDTLVAVFPDFHDRVFETREWVLERAREEAGIELHGGWGVGMTLARINRKPTPEEIAATNACVSGRTVVPHGPLAASEILVGGFVVKNDRFELEQRSVANL